jgi:hypothetical protein
MGFSFRVLVFKRKKPQSPGLAITVFRLSVITVQAVVGYPQWFPPALIKIGPRMTDSCLNTFLLYADKTAR